ncbi:unnamed protein product [Lymnaea stagnalis]|uniref:C2H2-type domain-containing protein n=1 Tax=Lymnaea stagnalis TaxID=6523 RepID=A0AAV2IJP1_LYMST
MSVRYNIEMAAYHNREKKNGVTSSATQTEIVSSEILWQCLYVIKSEFENLSYRVTKTQNGQEALVVYRNDVFGVYGPPIDPITLTLDPLGKCLLTILFKPLQRVSVVNPESGCIEINSLLTVLRLVEGKNYNFCPGIPEKFLIGKACNRHVILQKVPFKRFQSTNCPVYYQTPLLQQRSSKSPYLTICPRCLQAAKWAQTLPLQPFPNPQLLQMNGLRPREPQELFSRDIHPMMSSPNNLRVISVSPLAMGSVFSSSVPPKLQDVEKQTGLLQNNSTLDVNGNRNVASLTLQETESVGEVKSPSLMDKLQMATTSLRLMLQEKYKKKTLGFPVEDIKVEYDKKQESVKKQRSNICKQCKKQFSTPASLLNHLQRHEGLSGSWKNRPHAAGKLYTSRRFSPLVRMVIRGSKTHDVPQGKKKSSPLSQTNLRLVLKCLDDILLSLNGTQFVKGKDSSQDVEHQGNKLETKEHDVQTRPSLKRTSSGLAAVQTLLEAAKIAGDGFDDVNKAANSFTDHEGAPGRKRKKVAAVFPVQHPPAEISDDQDDLITGSDKKPRKSPRLATKKSKSKGLNSCKSTKQQTTFKNSENSTSANDPGLLRNLDLLSSVSLNYHPSADSSNAAPVTSQPPQICTSTAAYPNGAGITFSTSATNSTPATQNISISNHLLNNTSGGSVVLTNKFQDSDLRNSTNLPPLPPLLFAGNGPGQGFSYNHSKSQPQQLSGQPFPSTSPSILKNLVLTSKTPTLSSVDSGLGDDLSSSECGAIDLSKPKQLKVAKTIPQNYEKTFDITGLSGLPHNFAQLVSGNDNPREMLQCLMRMSNKPASPVAPSKLVQPPESIISNKQSDSNLQARMFASARNYKIDKKIPSIPHVQAVIASTNRTPTNKGGKSAVHGGTQGDEIHCGYKWSGSGGLVKERTQMVRELVPVDVMSNFLSKSALPTSNSHQLNMNLISPSQALPQLPPMLLLPSPTSCSPVNKQQDHSAPQIALNLTTTKAKRIPSPRKSGPGRPRKSALQPPVPMSPSSPGSTPSSILRSSLLNPLGTGPQPVGGRMSLDAGNGPKSPQKSMNSSFMNIPSPTSILSSASTTPTPPTNCTISSPSLAAMLRQPASTKHDMNHVDALMNSHRGSPMIISHNSPIHVGNTITLPGGVQIKSEPSDNYMHDSSQARIIMSLPVKSEFVGQPLHRGDSHMISDDDSSSTDLIMDIRGEYSASRYGEDLSMTHIHSVSRTADRNSDNSAVKCEH